MKIKCLRKTRRLIKMELSAKNALSAITTLAIRVLQHSFGTIKWTQAEMRAMDGKPQKLQSIHGAQYLWSDAARLYVPRRDEGLTKLEASDEIATQGLVQHLELKQQIFKKHKNTEGNKPGGINTSKITQVKNIKAEMREKKKQEKIGKKKGCAVKYSKKQRRKLSMKENHGIA